MSNRTRAGDVLTLEMLHIESTVELEDSSKYRRVNNGEN